MALRVLVVDDEPPICELLADCLGGAGYQVTTATTGAQGLDLLRQEDFHFMLLDLRLDPTKSGEELDGLELLPKIRDVDHDVAIVVLTAHPSVASAAKSITHQVSGYITKPFDVKELLDNLERIARLKGYLVDNEDAFLEGIGRNVRELRRRHGLTLKQAARRSGLSPAMISMIERGETAASVVALYRLAIAFSVKISALFESD